jgi:hypothetical protein
VKRKALIALVLGISLIVVPPANAMWLADGGSSSSTVKLTPQQAQFYVMHGTVPSSYVGIQPTIKLTPQQAPFYILHGIVPATYAGIERSVSLTPQQAQFYVLHGVVPKAGPSVSAAPLKTSGNSFAWSDAAYGAGAVLAAMLLALATVIGTRRRSHRLSF